MNTPIPNRHAIQQLEQTLQSLGATLVPQADKPDAKNLLTHAQQTCQQLDQVLCDHLTVLREAELALSCVLTLLLRHDEHPFPAGKSACC